MKLTVDSTLLSRVCSAAAKNINSKVALPILECFLIETNGDSITVVASDNSNMSRYHLAESVTVEQGGGELFCISSSKLLSILGALPQQPITIETAGQSATIKWNMGQGHATLPIESADEFPSATMPTANESTMHVVCLQNIMNDVAFAVGDDELRPIMSSTYFDYAGEKLVCVGSDGHRLVKEVVSEVEAGEKLPFALPRMCNKIVDSFTKEVRRTNGEAMVTITWDEKKVAFSAEGHTVSFVLCEGRYPNYNSVIPPHGTMSADVNREALIGALRRTMVFANKTTSLIKLQFTEKELTVSASDIDYSVSSDERVPASMTGVECLTIGVKGTFLLDILTHFYTEEIHIEGTDHSRALVFRGIYTEDQEVEDRLMLLMPMMLND